MNLFTTNIINETVNIKLPWIEKYRPNTLDTLLLAPLIKRKILYFLENKIIPNLIVTGEPGTGKTSTILFLANQLYNKYYNDNVLELNASDDRGLSIITTVIYPFCKKKVVNGKDTIIPQHKLIILDEADSITIKAQNLLSNLLSDFRYNTRIIFICNIDSQIIEPIQSKCMIIKMPSISKQNLINKIEYICKLENIPYSIDAINTLIEKSNYDIRTSINYLECIYYMYNKLSIDNINQIIRYSKYHYISKIIDYCIKNDYINVIKTVNELNQKKYTTNDILLSFMKYLFDSKVDTSNINNDMKIDIYKILSSVYVNINNNIDTQLQFYSCISQIFNCINQL